MRKWLPNVGRDLPVGGDAAAQGLIIVLRYSVANGSEPTKKARARKVVTKKAPPRSSVLPDRVDAKTIERLVAEAEHGIGEAKLRRRGRPSIGDEASSTYSARLPDDLVLLVDERSALDGVTRGETIRRALIAYLTK
jgi:hypothetical protein